MRRKLLLVLGLWVLGAGAEVAGQTKITDPMPVFNLEYFVGTWSFEWTVPDSPLGPGGDLTGTQTYALLKPPVTFARIAGFPAVPASSVPLRFLSHPMLDGRMQGTAPDGALKSRVLIGFDPTTKDAIRVEIQSRGAPTTRTGTIGGDLGGTFTFFWDSTPVKKGTQTVKLQGRTTMYSPTSFREQISYAVDGSPFKIYGQPWYEKKDK